MIRIFCKAYCEFFNQVTKTTLNNNIIIIKYNNTLLKKQLSILQFSHAWFLLRGKLFLYAYSGIYMEHRDRSDPSKCINDLNHELWARRNNWRNIRSRKREGLFSIAARIKRIRGRAVLIFTIRHVEL